MGAEVAGLVWATSQLERRELALSAVEGPSSALFFSGHPEPERSRKPALSNVEGGKDPFSFRLRVKFGVALGSASAPLRCAVPRLVWAMMRKSAKRGSRPRHRPLATAASVQEGSRVQARPPYSSTPNSPGSRPQKSTTFRLAATQSARGVTTSICSGLASNSSQVGQKRLTERGNRGRRHIILPALPEYPLRAVAAANGAVHVQLQSRSVDYR